MTAAAFRIPPISGDLDWRTGAPCGSGWWPIDWWSAATPTDMGRAVWVCRNICDRQAACLDWALVHPEQCNGCVYGGIYFCQPRGGGVEATRPSPRQPAPLRPDTQPLPGRRKWVPLPAGVTP